MGTPTLGHYLVLSGLLFAIGLAGVIVRRDLLIMYMCLEIMLNAANLSLVAFSRFSQQIRGQVLVFFVITVAAVEVAVGLALLVSLYRMKRTTKAEEITALKF